MQLGFVSAILPELSLDEVLRIAAEESFDSVEVMCWPPGRAERKFAGVTHIDCTDLSSAAADDIGALVEKHGVAISGLGYYPNPLSGDAAEAETALAHLKRVIAAAPRLGLKNVNTFIGADHRLNSEENFARFRQVWPDMVRHAEDHDVYIGIENCPMLFTFDEWPAGKNLAYSPAVWRRMFETIPSDHFGLNFDPSHCIILMIDYLAPLYEFRHKLFHLHAKDMKIDRRKLNDRGILGLGWTTPKVPGLGEIDWAAFVSTLTDVGYEGHVAIEVEDDAFAGSLERRITSLRVARNVLRPLIP